MRILLIQFLLFAGVFVAPANPWIKKQSVQDPTRAQSVYVEFGGPSAIYSITYDTRFARRSDGWGFRGGIGFWPRRGINHISIPVQVNYLLGGTRHFFEAGAGATYFHGDQGDSWFSPATEGSLVFGSLSAGYRYQPRSQGITARIGITGIVGPFSSNSIAPLPYLSVGYRF